MRTTAAAALALLMLAGCTAPTPIPLELKASCESSTEIGAVVAGMSRGQTVTSVATAGGVVTRHRASDAAMPWDSLTISATQPVRIAVVLSDGTELTKTIDCTEN